MESNEQYAEPRLYPLRETAVLLGRSTRWVKERIKAGELEAYSLPRLVVPGYSINNYLRMRKVA